jgi:hypothetical protein
MTKGVGEHPHVGVGGLADLRDGVDK